MFDGDHMESNSHSFIIRVWVEEAQGKPRLVLWRGHITHVPDGERRYFQTLGDISSFVALYLQEMGVRLALSWRIRQWFKRLRA